MAKIEKHLDPNRILKILNQDKNSSPASSKKYNANELLEAKVRPKKENKSEKKGKNNFKLV